MTLGASPREWARERPDADQSGALWLGLAVAILLLLPAGTPRPIVVLYLLLLVGTLLATLRFRIALLGIVALAVTGVGLRFALYGIGSSDVLAVTSSAIAEVLSGGNPYGIGYSNTVPPGAPFAYGPVSLLWYLPARLDPVRLEFAVSLLIVLLLAVRGRPLGLAIYATAPTLLSTASDGSNDTSAGLFLLLALVVARRDARWGAVLLALATAFKPYLAAWLPGLIAYGGLGAVVGFAAGTLATWGPALLIWGPASILTSYRMAEDVHTSSYYSLAYLIEGLRGHRVSQEAFDRLRLVLGALTALVTFPFARSFRAMVMSGVAVYLVTLYTGYWSTFAYVSAIAPVICWYVDDWVGLARGRVRWPSDPVGRLGDALDRRWPPRPGHDRQATTAP